MERLQKALEIARDQRGGTASGKPRPAAPKQRPGRVPASNEAVWDALTPVELDVEHLTRNRIVSSKSDAAAVSFDVLRTKIQLNMEKNGWKRLAITSPAPSCGKTTVACNLAAGFARQNENRAIMFEFDMRRPNMHSLLGLERQGTTVEDVLTGQVDFADQAVRLKDTVALSLARRPAHDPGNLMVRQKTFNVIADIEARYAPDLMIFDLPPLLASEDTRAFLRNVDCVLVVAAAGSSSVREIDICEQEIAEHTQMLGVVLNRCRHTDDSNSYYGDY